jgi:hypothetical protein
MRRLIAVFRRPRLVALAFALGLAALAPATATAQTGPTFVVAPQLNPRLAMTGPAAAGQPVQLAPNTGAPAQLWEFTNPNFDNQVTQIVNQQTGLCLDVTSTTSGATVIAATCNGSRTQQWVPADQANGSFRILNVSSTGMTPRNPLVVTAAVGTPDVVLATNVGTDPTQQWLLQSGLLGGPGPGPGPGGPATKDQCKKGGYVQFGFKNQGQCVASVQRHPAR